MRISASATTSLLRETVEMIFMDKSPLADAVGALSPWDQGGRPEMIVLDRGPNYVTDEVYDLLAALGITNLGAPAKKPWLRPFIERLFRTIHAGFLQRFSGRTFSDVVSKGENDAEGRASITIDEFLHWLVRWIVDIYHNTAHEGLGRRTPAEAWAQSQAACRLQSVSREEMRKVFGVRLERKLDRSGIRVMGINYQSDALANLFFSGLAGDTFEVSWWQRDIGAILVKIAPDRWITVPAADPMWIGASLDDLRILKYQMTAQREVTDAIKAKALVEIMGASYRAKALRGLLPLTVTGENFTRLGAEFSRFMNTAERQFDRGESADLFDGTVELAPPPSGLSNNGTAAASDDDLME